MKRILVVYYSRTGHVRTVAEAIARDCAADIEEIHEARPRRGLLGWLRSIVEVRRGTCPPIASPLRNPSGCDLVVLGGPVWASRMASPMRSFLTSHAARLPRIALFCTMGGRGGEKVLDEMASLCGKQPIATMVLRDTELEHGQMGKVAEFVAALAPAATRPAAG